MKMTYTLDREEIKDILLAKIKIYASEPEKYDYKIDRDYNLPLDVTISIEPKEKQEEVASGENS